METALAALVTLERYVTASVSPGGSVWNANTLAVVINQLHRNAVTSMEHVLARLAIKEKGVVR